MANLNFNTSRRDALKMAGGVAVATLAGGALVGAAMAENADSLLIALEREYWDTTTAMCDLINAADEIDFSRTGRVQCPSYKTYDRVAGEMRSSIFMSRGDIDHHYGSRGEMNSPAHKATLATWDAWEAQEAPNNQDPRVIEMNRRADALAERQKEIVDKIFATPAAGLAGIAVKLRVGSGTLFEPAQRDEFRTGKSADMGEAGAMSALLDCERLSGIPYPTDAMEA